MWIILHREAKSQSNDKFSIGVCVILALPGGTMYVQKKKNKIESSEQHLPESDAI